MSTTAKIDFEPGLFDEGQPEAAPEWPTAQPKRLANFAPLALAGVLLLVLAAGIFMLNASNKAKSIPAIPPESPQTPVGAFSVPNLTQGSQAIRKTLVGDSEGFCEGHEALCSTSTTDRPAETLAKLAAALPDVEAKRYRLKVSVGPLDD